jgi:ArsR family transcriptional regulator
MTNEQSFFDVLSDETRRRLLCLLLREGELCVCELHYALDMAQPKISRHLAAMRDIELLALRREGTRIFYRLDKRMPLWAFRILEVLPESGEHSSYIKQDLQRLRVMPNRPERLSA